MEQISRPDVGELQFFFKCDTSLYIELNFRTNGKNAYFLIEN